MNRNLYGSSLIGQEEIYEVIASTDNSGIDINTNTDMVIGDKRYTLSNHLGNVHQVVTDRKIPEEDNGNLAYFYPNVVSYADFLPFGSEIEVRSSSTSETDFGFNGMYKDDEVKGEGNSYTTEFRQYDPRVGRWLSLDPLEYEFPWQSPYVGLDNNPILLADPYGDSTFVESQEDGTYKVVGGNLEGDDKGIFIMDEGKLTGEKLGESLTTHSFVDENDEFVIGAVIDTKSSEGQDFIDDEIIKARPSLFSYMMNAYKVGLPLDFKSRGLDTPKPGSKDLLVHAARGSMTEGGKIASARDFGNMAAGIVAGRIGFSWSWTEMSFNILQGGPEPPVSALAQKIGHDIGLSLKKKADLVLYDDYLQRWKKGLLERE